MTSNDVKTIVRNEIERMRTKKHGCATDKMYQQGKAIGMLRAFQTAGLITNDERIDIVDELFEEYF